MSEYIISDEAPQKGYDGRLMRRILQYLRPYRWRVFFAIALVGLSKVLGLAGPYLVKVGIDSGILAGNSAVLLQVALLYLLFLVLEFGVSFAMATLVQTLGQRFMLDLRTQLFEHIQSLRIRTFDRNPVGRLMTRLTNDVETLNEMFTSGLITMFGDVFMLVGILVVLFRLDASLALVTLSILPFLAVITLYFRTRLRNNFRQVRERIAKINAYLQERLSGMEVIQVFVQERRAHERFRELNREHTDAHLGTVFNFSLFWPLVDLVSNLSIALILWFSGRWVLAAAGVETTNDGLTFGTLAAFIQYAQSFFRPLSDLSEKFNIMQGAMASSERIFALLDTEGEAPDPTRQVILSPCRGEIEFSNVSFAYNPGEPVLEDLSFRLEAGQTLALVGLTGSGKSTIINLLLRFYDVDAGRIRLDGVDVNELALSELRRHFALVQQDVFLFPTSVAENINLGDQTIGSERVREAAHTVGAHDFIMQLPQGYDTVLQARGGGLSMGQRQLIAFARALAFDPAVLILDEATSSVDTETEHVIQTGLERLLSGRSSLVVAHRLSTIQKADRILVLHQGRLAESGNHGELLTQGGLYSRLYQLQFLDDQL